MSGPAWGVAQGRLERYNDVGRAVKGCRKRADNLDPSRPIEEIVLSGEAATPRAARLG